MKFWPKCWIPLSTIQKSHQNGQSMRKKTQAFLHHFCRTDFKGLKAQNCGRGQRKLGTISWKPKAKSVKHRNEKLSCWRSICHFLSSEVLFSTQNDSFSISNVKCEKWFFTLNKKEKNRILYPKVFQTLDHQILNVTCLKSVLCTLFENYPKCRICLTASFRFLKTCENYQFLAFLLTLSTQNVNEAHFARNVEWDFSMIFKHCVVHQ